MDDGSYQYINYRYKTRDECLIKTRWKVVVDPDNVGEYELIPLDANGNKESVRVYGESADYGCAFRSNSLLKALYHYTINHHDAFKCLYESYDPYNIFGDYGKYRPLLNITDTSKYGKCKF